MTNPDFAARSAQAKAQTRNGDVGTTGNPSLFVTDKANEQGATAVASLNRPSPRGWGDRYYESFNESVYGDDARIAYSERGLIDEIGAALPFPSVATSLLVEHYSDYDSSGIRFVALLDVDGEPIEDFDELAVDSAVMKYSEVFSDYDTVRRRTAFELTENDDLNMFTLNLSQDRAAAIGHELNSYDLQIEEIVKQRNAAVGELLSELASKSTAGIGAVQTIDGKLVGVLTRDGQDVNASDDETENAARKVFWDQALVAVPRFDNAHLENTTVDSSGRTTIWF